MKYALLCSCGNRNIVDSGQAGQTIVCKCGQSLEVPTMRGLSQLEQVDEPVLARRSIESGWGARQGLLFLGTLLALLAFGASIYLYTTRPELPEHRADPEAFDAMNAPEAWEWWEMMQSVGVELPPSPHEAAIRSEIASRTRWAMVAGAVGVVGVLLAIAGLLVRPPRAGT